MSSADDRRVVVTCKACGAAGEHVAALGANRVTVEHDGPCPFLAAVELGPMPAAAWIATNGYPITVREQPGPAPVVDFDDPRIS